MYLSGIKCGFKRDLLVVQKYFYAFSKGKNFYSKENFASPSYQLKTNYTYATQHFYMQWLTLMFFKGNLKGIVREFGLDLYTLLYLKWIANKGLLYSTCGSAQCHVAVWRGGVFRGEWMYV